MAWLFVWGALGLAMAPPIPGEPSSPPAPWEVQPVFRDEVGDMFHLEASAEERLEWHTEPPRVRVRTIALSANVRVLRVGAQARATALEVVVERLKAGSDGTALSWRDRTLTLSRGAGEARFVEQGRALPTWLQAALGMVLSLSDSERPAWRQVFGTDLRRVVGEQWPADREQLVKWLVSEGVVGAIPRTRGGARLMRIDPCTARRCLVVRTRVSAERFGLRGSPQFQSPEARLKREETWSWPLEARRPWQESLRLEMVTTRPERPKAVLVTRTLTRTIRRQPRHPGR